MAPAKASKLLAGGAADAGYGTMPSSRATPSTIEMKQADGSVKKTKLAKRGATLCCVEPAGGWYGPFGFLRLVAYLFGLVAVLSALSLLVCIRYRDFAGVLCCVVLGGGAVLATAAAFSHEGLARMANALDRQNRRYVALRKKFDDQLDGLVDTRERLDDVQRDLEGTGKELMKAIEKLAWFGDLQQVLTIISCFVDADNFSGERNARLSTKGQTGDFFFGIQPVLEKECPWLEINELRELTDEKGIDTNIVSLLIGAVINDDDTKRKRAITTLMFFALDADNPDRLDDTVEELLPFLGSHPSKKFGHGKKGLRATLKRFVKASEDGVLLPKHCQRLCRALLAHGPWDAVSVEIGK